MNAPKMSIPAWWLVLAAYGKTRTQHKKWTFKKSTLSGAMNVATFPVLVLAGDKWLHMLPSAFFDATMVNWCRAAQSK